MRQVYKGFVNSPLQDNEYFVFGSNTQGRHGKGAALVAKRKFGAIYGQALGYQGQSYAIVTKDLTRSFHPSVSRDYIISQIVVLYRYAGYHTNHKYYIAYSGTGTNLNNYSPQEMADMFKAAGPIPSNIIFEETFWLLVTTSSAKQLNRVITTTKPSRK
jgi:hypothetical protein